MVQFLAVLVMGLGIGWLAGLSVSPVIATVLASLMGVGAGLVAGLRGAGSGTGDTASRSGLSVIDARPAAILVLGIALGAPVGILARTHQLLEPASSPTRTDESVQGVLFNVTTEHCDRLRARARDSNEQAFRNALAGTSEWGRLLEEHVADTRALKAIVEGICDSE